MGRWAGRIVGIMLLLALLGGLGWSLYAKLGTDDAPPRARDAGPAAVAVAPVEHGRIVLVRTFSGTLESPSEFIAAPKVSGVIERLMVDVADTVRRGQVVAELDSDEYVQAVAQADADLAVAKATRTEAENGLEIARRNLARMETLRERGVASESQYDTARADELAREADVAVAEARITRAEAALAAARIRLSYTQVTVSWAGGDDERVVAEQFAEEGDTLSANAPLLSVVELDPIQAVLFVTERDYGRLRTGQSVSMQTDAYPGETFTGRVTRIAPIFRASSRQARVEVVADNPDGRLKPGMFVRATVQLDQVDDATIIPAQALTRRGDADGVFVVDEDAMTVAWRPVTVGIRQDDRVQALGEGITGRVVTLGQQLVDDGSAITIPDDERRRGADAATAEAAGP